MFVEGGKGNESFWNKYAFLVRKHCFSGQKRLGYQTIREDFGLKPSLAYGLLLDFNFFLHVYLLTVGIVEDVLQKREFLVGNHFDTKSVLHLPLALQGYEALVDVGGDVRVDV